MTAPAGQIHEQAPFEPERVTRRVGNVVYHPEVYQGSEEWAALRCGLLTASEMKLLFTPALKPAVNDKTRAHVYEIAAQRISRHVEPHYIGDDMLRGHQEEVEARILYEKQYAPVTECGFVTNDKWGFTLGYSPDGLVGDDGLIEAKSRRQRFQIETIAEYVWIGKSAKAPSEFVIQLQTGLLISERKWIDFLSYSNGLPMVAIRVYPDDMLQDAILETAAEFEAQVLERMENYGNALGSDARLTPTERRVEQEMIL